MRIQKWFTNYPWFTNTLTRSTQTVNKSNITLNLVNFCTQNSPIFLHQKFKFFAQTCSVICDLVQLEFKFEKKFIQNVTFLANPIVQNTHIIADQA